MKLLLLLLVFFSSPIKAETVWEYVDSKLEKKEFKRWSLSSWFYQKEQMNLQDQWLSMNLDNDGLFVEFYLDYSQIKFDADTSDNENEETSGKIGEVAAYIGFLGISGRSEEYDDIYKQKEVALNLRLIGSSHQSTHLILTYGSRDFFGNSEEDFTQNFYGADMSLYLLPFLGFDTRYRVYINSKNKDETYELESTRSQWGAFIDISFARIFAYQFEENLDFKTIATGSIQERQIKGTGLGLRLYF